MTIKECYDLIGKKVYCGEYCKGKTIYCWPVTLRGVYEDEVDIGERDRVSPKCLFKTERDFLSACQNLKWYHFKERLKRYLG